MADSVVTGHLGQLGAGATPGYPSGPSDQPKISGKPMGKAPRKVRDMICEWFSFSTSHSVSLTPDLLKQTQ